MRARRCLLLALFAYVLLDLGCPFVPGAFSFDPDESVDAVGVYRARPTAAPRVATVPFITATLVPLAHADHGRPGLTAAVPPAGWRPHTARERLGAPEPLPSTDDD